MLDKTTLPQPVRKPWIETLTHGDIVVFRFPLEDEAPTEMPKAHPCLVLDTITLAGERFAVLAYGTTSTSRTNCGYEIRLQDEGACTAAGLHEPTRFVGSRRIMVPLTDPGFAVCPKTGAPVLGRLHGAAFARLNAVRARIHAERDIAADRRQSRRRARRRRAIRGVDFTVERRRPRARRARSRTR